MCFDSCDNMYMGSRLCRIRAITPTLPVNGVLCGLNITAGVATPPGLPEGEEMLRVFPNPNDGTFMVHVPSGVNVPVQITVTNILGQKVKEISAATNKDIPLQLRVPKGMYFVNVVSEKGPDNYRGCGKIIVE
jgi:hypothetical protein